MRSSRCRSAGQRATGLVGLWLLLAALLCSQWLGQWHRVAHAPALAGAALSGHGVALHAPQGAHPSEGASAECRLFDQLACGDLLNSVLPIVLAMPALALPGIAPTAGLWASRPDAFQARGPPTVC